MASTTMLLGSCKKRKGILPKAVLFIVGVITSNEATPSQKDGALHMVNSYNSFNKIFCINCILHCVIAWYIS